MYLYFEGELRVRPFYSQGEPRVCTFTLKECQQLELSDSVLELPQLGTTVIGRGCRVGRGPPGGGGGGPPGVTQWVRVQVADVPQRVAGVLPAQT